MSVREIYTPEQTDWSGWVLWATYPDRHYQVWMKYERGENGRPGKYHFREVYDSQPAVDYAKALRDNPAPKGGDQEWTRQQMVIPPCMLNQSIREGWYADTAKWRRIMSDPDYKKLRTTDEAV